MTPWVVLVAFTGAINLLIFVALRGRWGRIVAVLGAAAMLGAAVGDAVVGRTGLEPVRIGDFHLVGASLGAQVFMIAATLLGAMMPARTAEE